VLGILAELTPSCGIGIGTCIGPTGPSKLLPGRFVLICEEGLVPPINTNSSDNVFAKRRQQRREQGCRRFLAAYLAIPGEVDLQGFGIVLEAKRSHGKQNILAVDRFALLLLALFGCCGQASVAGARHMHLKHTFACDKGDELAHALLHAFFRFFGDFGVLGECHLHNTGDWSKVTYVSIRCKTGVCAFRAVLWRRGGRGRRLGRHGAAAGRPFCRYTATLIGGRASEAGDSAGWRLRRAINGMVRIQQRRLAAIR
jgi:hypothetical protein